MVLVGAGEPAPERRSFRAPLLPNLHQPCWFRTPGIAPRSDIATAMTRETKTVVQATSGRGLCIKVHKKVARLLQRRAAPLDGDHQHDSRENSSHECGVSAVHVGVRVAGNRQHVVGCSRSGEAETQDQNFGAPVKELPPLELSGKLPKTKQSRTTHAAPIQHAIRSSMQTGALAMRF